MRSYLPTTFLQVGAGPPRRSGTRTHSTVKLRPVTRHSRVNPVRILPPSSPPQVTQSESTITLHWSPDLIQSPQSKYHHIWLRDHCRCPQCFHEVTKQRLMDIFSIPKEVRPFEVRAMSDGLSVIWNDNAGQKAHPSLYPWEWLARNAYDPAPLTIKPISKSFWLSSISSNPPTVQYSDVMSSDRSVYEWMKNVDQYGFCFVDGTPPTPEDTETLIKRIGPIRETHYGGFWDFTADLKHGDTAYTDIALGAHTDTTYFVDPCALQIFHLIQPAPRGGKSLLVDGFYVASLLRQRHPAYFDILSKVKVHCRAAGEEDRLYMNDDEGNPIIQLDGEGEVESIRWNNDDRGVITRFGDVGVETWYDALRTWNSLIKDASSEYWVPLKAGRVVVIDNHRVMHGRASFTGERRMCGGYISTDEYRSRLRVLGERYGGSCNGEGVKRGIWNVGL